MNLSDFDFDLPAELIAQSPAAERSSARLLHVDQRALHDRTVADLPELLAPGDLLIINDTRVLKARLLGQKVDTGGRIEALVERVVDERQAVVQMRSSKTPPPGTRLRFGETPDAPQAVVIGRQGEFFVIEFDHPVEQVLEAVGRTPLPPYITHTPGPDDDARYQTVYAREPGAVAAPTAGLHFDDALFEALARRGVQTARLTLHVGAGTFAPVRVTDPTQHVMHEERYRIGEDTARAIAATRAAGGAIVAVGTTSLRALESAAAAAASDPACAGALIVPTEAATRLFITPGYRFKVVDRLLTNFHLPRSTLMMLVSAFAGTETIRAAYAHAIAARYRFFSYGDAMLLDRTSQPD